jgi:hypothetical protein
MKFDLVKRVQRGCGWIGFSWVYYNGTPSVQDPGGFVRGGLDVNVGFGFGFIRIRFAGRAV